MDTEVFHERFQRAAVQTLESVDENVPYFQTEMLWHL